MLHMVFRTKRAGNQPGKRLCFGLWCVIGENQQHKFSLTPDGMPRISEFFGISIYLYFDDKSRHSLAHIHAKYGGEEAVYAIPEGDLLAGSLPPRQERLVRGWIALRAQELEQAWDCAVRMEDPGHIEPLS